MPTVTTVANSLTLAVGTVTAAECQVVNLSFTFPGSGEATVVFVACPDDAVSEPGEPVKGTLTGEVFADYGATGITRFLIDNMGDEVTYTLVLNPDVAGQKVTVTGNAVPQPVQIDWAPRKNQRHPLNLNVITAAVTYA